MVAPCGRASCEGREKRLSCKKTASRVVLVGEADARQEARNCLGQGIEKLLLLLVLCSSKGLRALLAFKATGEHIHVPEAFMCNVRKMLHEDKHCYTVGRSIHMNV